MGTITGLPREILPYAAVPMDGYINARSLAAMTAERIAIPTGAIAVLFSATDHFVAKSGDSAVTVTWPADDDTGASGEVNPTIRRLNGVDTHISVMLKGAGEISARFFSKLV